MLQRFFSQAAHRIISRRLTIANVQHQDVLLASGGVEPRDAPYTTVCVAPDLNLGLASVHPVMTDLPHARTHYEFPLHTGIDYVMYIRSKKQKTQESSRLNKSYIYVFTCLAVKALILQLATD